MLSGLEILDKVSLVRFKSDSELAYIYKKALVYVLPSLYEGFGMTALEAFSMGCPVVTSNTSSIPEVCGKAVVYINPEDKTSIRNSIEKVMRDGNLRKSLIQLGLAQVKKFNWVKTAEETLLLYNKMIKSNS